MMRIMRAGLRAGVVLTLSTACASGRMGEQGSVREHQEAAKANEELVAAHQQAAAEAEPCNSGDVFELCWTLPDTPEAHQDLAMRHRRMAAAHTEAAEALKQAEDAACVGVAAADRETSPFLRSRDIVATQLLDPGAAETELEIPVVRVVFAAVPRLDVTTLQRLLDCHLARNAALGHDVPEME